MKVLLSGGGTAGHITPLLAVAKEIRGIEPGVTVLFMGQRGDSSIEAIRRCGDISKVYTIHAGKFRRFHSLTLLQNIMNFKVNLLNIRDIVLILAGFFQSLVMIAKIRPDVIFFKGGFVVVPIGFAARLLRIPYITHDSDPLPGLANRLIARGATKNAVVNAEVSVYPSDKTVVTGVPLIEEYTQRRGVNQASYKKILKFPVDCTLLFVYTGTQGARIVDDAMEKALPGLFDAYPNLHVAYVFGRLNEASMADRFSELSANGSERLHRTTFISNAYDYIAAADIIVARAGATSMAEFATIGRASIIVPAEQLTGGHQLMNARMYAANNAAVIVKEKELADGELARAIKKLIDSPEERQRLASLIQTLAPKNAARSIAELLLGIGKEAE